MSMKLIDGYSRPKFHRAAVMEWFSFRLDWLALITFTSLIAFLIYVPKGTIQPGVAGLAVIYGLDLSMLFDFAIWHITHLENKIISAERILQYINIPCEPPLVVESNRPDSQWPSQGEVDIRNLKVRKLEAQLDEQMHLYRKLVSRKVDDFNDNDFEVGIDQLLKQLQQVNVQMQAWVSSGGSEIFSHTLTRHQEILQDLTQEFNRLQSSHRAKKEHASLLDDFREFDRTRLELEEGGGSYEQDLLKERASVH